MYLDILLKNVLKLKILFFKKAQDFTEDVAL